MTNKETRYALMRYYANLYRCSPDDFISDENRIYRGENPDDAFFSMRCFGGAAVGMAHPDIHEWAKEFVSKYTGFRCYDGIQMSLAAQELKNHGYALGCGQGALPDMGVRRDVPPHGYPVRDYGEAQIRSLFADDIDSSEWHMLHYSEISRMASAAIVDGRIVGIAMADMDAEDVWDVGYEVLPAYRGQGIATVLTMQLTNRILAKGVIPFATFAWSNIASKGVLYRCGYYTAWSNMGSVGMEWAQKVINGMAE